MKPKTEKAKARISKAISDHAVANTWWDPASLPSWLTEKYYVEKVQPLLKSKKVREIAGVMQVSKPYAAFVRIGTTPTAPEALEVPSRTGWRHRLSLTRIPNNTVGLFQPNHR